MEASDEMHVTDAAEVAAVKAGEIPGSVYRDGEVWAEMKALREWRAQRGYTATINTGESSAP